MSQDLQNPIHALFQSTYINYSTYWVWKNIAKKIWQWLLLKKARSFDQMWKYVHPAWNALAFKLKFIAFTFLIFSLRKRSCFPKRKCVKNIGKFGTPKFQKILSKYKWVQKGIDCGSVGRVVASDTRGPQFESSHRQIFILNQY